MADARMTALRGLSEVFGQGGYSNLVLERLMRNNELSGQEHAFCTALFYGVVERRITLDWVLGRYSRQPVEKLSPDDFRGFPVSTSKGPTPWYFPGSCWA